MPLTPKFTLTPLNPYSNSYDNVNEEYTHYAYLKCFGAYVHFTLTKNLPAQYNENKIVLGCIPIDTPASTDFPYPYYKHSCAYISFKTNATTEDQYLLVYTLKGSGNARAAFFINGNLVRSEQIDGEENIAILVDCPESQTWWYSYIFLEGGGILEFKTLECYVL
jgi:hypothetical protein